ncbi:MAG: hypothetical protein R3C59_31360 [Planctomycetaceae bacterium]
MGQATVMNQPERFFSTREANMTTPQTSGTFPSVQLVKALLAETKRLRLDWAGLGSDFAAAFAAFREDGAALPKAFLDQYAELKRRKDELAVRIKAECRAAESSEWMAPSVDHSLKEFETRLEELRAICRAIEKQIAEKRRQASTILTSVTQLTTTDATLMSVIADLQQHADQWLTRLSAEPDCVNETDHDQQLNPFQCLLRLVGDAMARQQSASQNPTARMLSWDECDADLKVVTEAFGHRTAIEALRGLLSTGSDGDQTTPRSPGPSAGASLSSTTPDRQQVASLTGWAGPQGFAAETEFAVSSQQLAEASGRLRGRAWNLCPDLSAPFAASSDQSPDRLRAIGYLNLSQAIDLTGSLIAVRSQHPQLYQQEMQTLLGLFAEAQCAVRTEREQSGSDSPLKEQQLVWRWLCHYADQSDDGPTIERYLSSTDTADPANNADLARRLRNFEQVWKAAWRKDTSRAALEQAVADFRSGMLSGLTPSAADWQRIDRCVVETLRCGIRPQDERLRELLLPIADAVPDGGIIPDVELSAGLRRVFSFIDEWVTRQALKQPYVREAVEETPVIKEARRLLAGQKVAIVGGTPIAHIRERLRQSLGLRKLKWLAANRSDCIRHPEARLRDVSLVILITGIVGSGHNDIRELCSGRDIPWVRAKICHGYNVDTIAAVIVGQAGRRLQTRDSGVSVSVRPPSVDVA